MASKSVLAVLTSSILAVSNVGFSATEAQATNCFTSTGTTITDANSDGNASCDDDELVIPNTITAIADQAFENNTSIKALSFEAGSALTTIGSGAFQAVSTLESVDLSQATLLNSVGSSAFSNATSLTSFKFGDAPNLTTLPGGFLYASGLSEVTIPASITTIGGGVFADSVSLATVNFLGDAPVSSPDSTFRGIAQNPVAIVSPTATGFDAAFETTTGLTVQIQASTPAAPVPYSGPLVTNIGSAVGAVNVFANETVTVSGERLSTVSKVFVDGVEGEVISTSADSFVMTVPEGLDPGTYDLVIQSSLGNLTYLDAFVVTEESIAAASYGEVSAWTTRISDTQAKVYVKYPTVGERVRIGHQTGGSGDYTTVYVKTTVSETDEAMIVNEHGSYIVRTIDLADINRIRVTVGEQTLVQVRYNR